MRYIYTVEELKDFFKRGNIVIYGAGEWGKRLADYVISAKLRDKIIGIAVSKMDGTCCQYRGIPLYEADDILERERCVVIIAVSWRWQEEIVQVVERHGKESCIFSHNVYWEIGEAMDEREKVPYRGIDFLVPGFGKCGTTSLHNALMTVRDLYLTQQKETHLFNWYNKVQNPEKILAENYFNNIRCGQIVGMIDPTFVTYAREVYDFFGSDIKLVFLVRNPVEATFSRFKMTLRGSAIGEELYQKYGKFSLKMFDDYLSWKNGERQSVVIAKYIDWIDTFREYYPIEQIKLVYFEELVSNPAEVINEILNFIGSKCKYENEKLPHTNEGNYVMSDLKSYEIARWYNKLFWEYRFGFENDSVKKDECYGEMMLARRKLEKAEKIYDIHISTEQRKRMEEYYNDSVRKLEKSFHKDLSQLWF